MASAIFAGSPSESQLSGADPWKLHRQIAKFGSSKDGMPPIFVYEDPNGVLEISDGVTRATRIAKLAPGALIPDHERRVMAEATSQSS